MTAAQQQSFAGLGGGGAGVRPRPVHLQDLRAPGQALPAVRDEVRLRLAPAGQCGRPFPRAPEIEDLQTALDDAAVDVARREGRDLAGLDGDNRVVEQAHAFLRLAQPDQDSPEALPRERDEIGIAEALADGGRLGESRVSVCGRTIENGVERERQPQIAFLDALALALFQQSLRARDPRERTRELVVLLQS